ncbi:helix-turn-helix domain-containing protein [Neobacillus drentensis]|uniref:helix-turn-helix domain-containing protein n=1 Tax=Neobacillus drentensis TaxID=220684 RepID=UPI0030013B66
MSNYPKALQTFVDPFLFQIFVDHNEGDWKMPFEWHDSLEIFYTLKGKGHYFIEDKFYTFQEGDMFIIGNNELHKSQLIDGEPFEALIIMFHPKIVRMLQTDNQYDPLTIFKERPPGFSHQMKMNQDDQIIFDMIRKQLQTEFELNRDDSMCSIVSLLNWLLVLINRQYEKEKQLPSLNPKYSFKLNNTISKALEYVNENFYKDLKLSDLAENLFVSPSYLSREFKRITGFTLIEFITSKRVRHAKNLLTHSYLQITDIASQVGYNNVTHFHLVFKKIVGMSPGEYRKYVSKID